MEINKKRLGSIIKSVFNRRRRYGEHKIMHPSREWVTGLALFFIISSAMAWWSASVYLDLGDKAKASIDVVVPEPTVYNEAVVSEALRIMQERAAETRLIEERLRLNRPTPPATPPVTDGDLNADASPDPELEL
jgi:hypothetical protein